MMRLSTILLAIALMVPTTAQAAGPSAHDVNVVNTPLPVSVQGGVNATITNFPGTINATITNFPPQPEPVTGVCTSSVIVLGRAACQPYGPVPAGKRLLVEMVSYSIFTDGTTSPPIQFLAGQSAGFTTTIIGEPNTYAFPITPGSPVGSGALSSETRTVRIYLDEGQSLILQANFTGPNNFVQTFTFSGVLANK